MPKEKKMKNRNEPSDILNEAKIPLANSETALTMTSNKPTWVCLKMGHSKNPPLITIFPTAKPLWGVPYPWTNPHVTKLTANSPLGSAKQRLIH
jgi:hypothetical protein